MKVKFMCAAVALLITSAGFSQTVTSQKKAPQKGYYAIGNNAEKYSQSPSALSNSKTTFTKGFFAQQMLHFKTTKPGLLVTNTSAIYTKGFYVGQNHQIWMANVAANKKQVADSNAGSIP